MNQSVSTFLRSALASALVLACSSVAAQQSALTVYGGVRGGGEFFDDNAGGTRIKLANGPVGALSFDWLFSDGTQGQVYFATQRSALPGSVLKQPDDIDVFVSYLHAGGRVFFHGGYNTHGAYVVGGLGMTFFSPRAGELSSEVRPSGNLGLGYQWMLSKDIALRAELRGYLTLVNSTGGFFCSGGCVVSIRGDTVSQGEGLFGVSFNF